MVSYPGEILEAKDGSFPSYVRVSVAAILACLALDEWNGEKYGEREKDAFVDRKVPTDTEGQWIVFLEPHEYLDIIPEGVLGKAFVAMQAALVQAVHAKDVPASVLRCSTDGVINPRETWLHTDDFERWAEQRSISLGDEFYDYVEGEGKIAEAGMTATFAARNRWEQATEFIRIERQTEAEAQWKEKYLELMVRKREPTRHESIPRALRPLQTRERNVLLTIIATLCRDQQIDFTKPAKAAGLILDMANRCGHRVSETAIENHLKNIPDALETRAK